MSMQKMKLAVLGMLVSVWCACYNAPQANQKQISTASLDKAKSEAQVLEIVVDKVQEKDPEIALRSACAKYHLPANSLYQWNDHYVIYTNAAIPQKLISDIKAQSGYTIKIYPSAFYNFNRKYCSDTVSANQWDNIILTANLVADPKKQQEYLNYHATQFQKWPEVSKGFCNASFQQLLVFKNGRQLMLVISIPKGESLDKLNPKTTENNPRVDDWNALMKQYQEGIAGTKPGEVWVFMQPIKL